MNTKGQAQNRHLFVFDFQIPLLVLVGKQPGGFQSEAYGKRVRGIVG